MVPDGRWLKQLEAEREVKALVLALSLGVVGPAVAHRDAAADQPGSKPGEGLAGVARAPGRAVVAEQTVGQAVAFEGVRELSLHGVSPLVRANTEAEVEAGVVVQDGQRLEGAGLRLDRPLEVHLPQPVRCLGFEALPVARLSAFRVQQAMAPQDVVDRRRRRQRLHTLATQVMVQLAAAPGRVLLPQTADQSLRRLSR